MKRFLTTLTLTLFAALTAFGAPLFSNRTSEWRIVVAPDASPTVRYAADELAAALQHLSGAKLPVVTSMPPSSAVIIGDLSDPAIKARRQALKLDGEEGDRIAVYTFDGNLYLAGDTPRGALYAVYTFLQRELGVRFLYPGKEGEVYPPRDSFELPKLAINHTPSFPYRGTHLCWRHVDPEFETWMARNGLNIMRSGPGDDTVLNERRKKGLHIMFSNHNVILPKELLATHPECFAELNGKRHERQICLTSAKAEELIVKRMADDVARHPELEILSIFPADNMDYCQCSGCTALDRSTVWFNFYKRVCDRLRERFPKLKFATIAYQDYLNVPQTDLSGSEFIEYCQHDRCYMHLIKSDCPLNQKSQERIAAWKKHGVPLGLYGYEFDIFATENSVMLPFYPLLAEGIRSFRDHGMKAVITEVWQDYPPKGGVTRKLSRQNAFNIYLYARMLWDADTDPEALLSDWNRHVYGAAAPEADAIMRKLAAWYLAIPSHITNYHNSPYGTAEKLLNPSRIAELDQLLKAGAAKLKTAQHQENLRYLESCVLQWQQAYWSATQSSNTVNVPRVEDSADPFRNAIRLPQCKANSSTARIPETDLYLSWDDQYLNIKAVCHDPNLKSLRTEMKIRDDKVYLDDCLEIFLSNPANRHGIYKQIAVNSAGTLMDAASYGPGGSDLKWNPAIQVKSATLPDGWTVELRIPFADNAPAPAAGESWRASFKRSIGNGREDFANSGYPDASYHDPNSFATLYFNGKTKTDKRLLVLAPPKAVADAKVLQDALLRDGWSADFCADATLLPVRQEQYDMLLIRLPQFGLDKNLKPGELAQDFLKRSKIVLFSSYEWLPLEQYFSDPSLKLTGSGWELDPLRKTVEIAPGNWSRKPDALEPQLQSALSAPWGYRGTDGKWCALATLKRRDGEVFPWLIARPCGNGLLVVTGADMGFAGGHVILGNGLVNTVPMLLNNLLANQQELQ